MVSPLGIPLDLKSAGTPGGDTLLETPRYSGAFNPSSAAIIRTYDTPSSNEWNHIEWQQQSIAIFHQILGVQHVAFRYHLRVFIAKGI